MAFYDFIRNTHPVIFSLVIACENPDFALIFDTNLRTSDDMPGRMQ